jgi:IS30 family transposase
MRLSKSEMAALLGKRPGSEAQRAAEQRRLDGKPSPKLGCPDLTEKILDMFKNDLSPDQISGRLGALYPGQPEMRVSTPAVYLYLYGETAKDPTLGVHFRQKQAKPRRRKGVKDRRGQIPDRISIDEHPKIVEEKTRAGDWEGDTIESAGKNACIATFADRKTKLLLARLMPDKTAASLNKAVAGTFGLVPSSDAAHPDGGQRQ